MPLFLLTALVIAFFLLVLSHDEAAEQSATDHLLLWQQYYNCVTDIRPTMTDYFI